MALKMLKRIPVKLQDSPVISDMPLSTAIYENRLKDKERVESELSLFEHGNDTSEFYTPAGKLIAVGYSRVVYGDHGPYIEFPADAIKIDLYRKFNQAPKVEAYYDWLETEDKEPVKVYNQLKTVHNLKNPPPGGFKGNREEGYADYRVGYLYISPFELTHKPVLSLGMDL